MSKELFQNLHLGEEKNGAETAALVKPLLLEGETIQMATKGIRDGAVITTSPIIVRNRQGINGKKFEFTTIPFRSIAAFTIEYSGILDLDAELTAFGSGFGKAKMKFLREFPITRQGALNTAAVIGA